ncbi:LysR substrate-binding domain-containing protein [Rhizobium populisoli]|uniref:LysR substrate-binding domain-containing protein n=1 Tax=Rhizobium populisoli TaxID=2859785 RepID=UPI0028AC185C|nr:LysR substrate-binding domain-containing protein [Rhizobium populisoli]
MGSSIRPTTFGPVALAVIPMRYIYRERAIKYLENKGRRGRISYASQGLMGVQAAVASGLGISLLPRSALLPGHMELDQQDGFEIQPDTELALVKGKDKLTPELQTFVDYLVEVVKV